MEYYLQIKNHVINNICPNGGNGIRTNTNGDLPLGLTIQANITDYPYYYACMETATPIVIDENKE